jgi:hypothetical protein
MTTVRVFFFFFYILMHGLTPEGVRPSLSNFWQFTVSYLQLRFLVG